MLDTFIYHWEIIELSQDSSTDLRLISATLPNCLHSLLQQTDDMKHLLHQFELSNLLSLTSCSQVNTLATHS